MSEWALQCILLIKYYGMETVRSATLPKRLSQLYADTKKPHDNVVRKPLESPQKSSLYLQLRYQKDRLIAWGLEWSNANNDEKGDIGGSLDLTGVNDLVTSIMNEIKELLDEAELLHEQQDATLSKRFLDSKGNTKQSREGQLWGSHDNRLEEILKDLTTSIDTLSDLSRPKFEEWKKKQASSNESDDKHNPGAFPAAPGNAVRLSIGNPARRASSLSNGRPQPSPSTFGGLTSLTRVQPRELRIISPLDRSKSSPPSYESVAAGSEDRVIAYYTPTDPTMLMNDVAVTTIPVLLDFGFHKDSRDYSGRRPDRRRYEELSTALQVYSEESEIDYTGLLKLIGWFADPHSARCAYVYKIPISQPAAKDQEAIIQPKSLLSYLQNSADADSNNMPCLENRFRLALNIALSLSHLHTRGVKHRNVNSNNIVFFASDAPQRETRKPWKGPLIRKPYLIAFDQSALSNPLEEQESEVAGIYHHPAIEEGKDGLYTIRYDYYSLGLILLEIGLWMPVGKFWKSKYTRADFKERLEDIYIKKLAAKCGTVYMQAVLYCLKAADQDWQQSREVDWNNNSDSCLLEEKQHPSIKGSDFWRNVVGPLKQSCSIDGNNEPLVLAKNPGRLQAGFLGIFGLAAQQPSQQQLSAVGTQGQVASTEVKSVGFTAETSQSETSMQKSALFHTTKVWSHEIPALYKNYWSTTMLPKLDRILSKAVSRWETINIELFLAGTHSDTARPTIYVECLSTDRVRKILRFLNKDLRLFEIWVASGQLIRSKARKKRRRSSRQTKSSQESAGSQTDVLNAGDESSHTNYQPRPACGASIGAFRDEKHLPPVSFGGAVLVNGEPFGMSVHHMLENDDEVESGLDHFVDTNRLQTLSCGRTQGNISGAENWHVLHNRIPGSFPSAGTEDSEEESRTSMNYAVSDSPNLSYPRNLIPSRPLYPMEIHEDEGLHVELDDLEDLDFLENLATWEREINQEEDAEDETTMGDTPGIEASQCESLLITQPAIDDVHEDFFPAEEDKDEEHLSSHTFGHVHASSGIRRSTREGIIHEIDWTLIQMKKSRMPYTNIIRGGGLHCAVDNQNTQIDTFPRNVTKATELGGLKVHALGRTSGLQNGVILDDMSMIRMPGRTSLSHSWQVAGNFGGKYMSTVCMIA